MCMGDDLFIGRKVKSMTQFYTIKTKQGRLIKNKDTNKIYLLEYPIQGIKIIENRFGNRKDLKVVPWRKRK